MSAEPAQGLAEWLGHNERSTQPRRQVGSWYPIAARFLHFCPFAGSFVDEHSDLILHCRCHTGQEFFAAQDRKAVELDAKR